MEITAESWRGSATAEPAPRKHPARYSALKGGITTERDGPYPFALPGGKTGGTYFDGKHVHQHEPAERTWAHFPSLAREFSLRKRIEIDGLLPNNVDREFIVTAVALLARNIWTCPAPWCERYYDSQAGLLQHVKSAHKAHEKFQVESREADNIRKLIRLLRSHHSSLKHYHAPIIKPSQEETAAAFIRPEEKSRDLKPEETQEQPFQQAMASPSRNQGETSDKPSQEEIAASWTKAEETSRLSGLEGTLDSVEGQIPEIRKEDSDTDAASRASGPNHPPQIGIATIRLQILSIRPVNVNDAESDDQGHSSLDFNDENYEITDADGEVGGGNVPHFGAAGTGSDSSGRDSGSARRQRDDEPPDQLRSHSSTASRSRKRQKTQDVRSERRRLACPYQAFEPWLRCGAKRKGFEDMTRLRHHFKRQHVRGRRCHRCWSSFDTDAHRTAHEERASCRELEESTDERFMNPEQENAIEQPSVNVGCKETTWWNMFHLLFPNLGGLNILNQPCSPYYVPSIDGIIVPPVVFPGNTFHTLATSDHENNAAGNATELTSGIPTIPQSANSAYLSGAFSVPVYSNTASLGLPATPLDFADLDQAAANWTQDQTNTTTESSSNGTQNWAFIGPIDGLGVPSETPSNRHSVAEQPLTARPSHKHYQQMYEQERLVNAQLETINAEFEQSNRANREHIRSVVLSLDEIITGGNIPDLIGRLLAARARLNEVNGRLMRNRT